MNFLTKLHFHNPIFSSITPKLLLNTIEKKVFLLAIAIFSSVSLLCFAVFTYLKNRKGVEIKNKENKEEQVNKEKQEIRVEEKEVPNDKPSQPVNGQVSPEKGEKIKSDQNSKLIPRPISEMSYAKNDMIEVFEIYAKQKDDTPIKAECEAYFKKGIFVPEDKIKRKTFYSIIERHPVLIDMMFHAGFESLNAYDADQALKEIIYSHFCAILDNNLTALACLPNNTIIQKRFLNYLQELLKTADKVSYSQSVKTYQRTIDHLFDKIKPEELATMIMNKAENPYNLIELLIKILKDEKQRKVVEASLPSFEDGLELEKLCKYGYESNVITLLSPQQIEILFQHWMTTLDEDKYLEEISLFIYRLWMKNNSMSNIRVIEDILTANPKINLEKLIAKNQYKNHPLGDRGHCLRPYLSGFYVTRHLEDMTDHNDVYYDKIIHTALGKYNLSEDEHTLLAKFLAERCSDIQLMNVISSFSRYNGPKQRLIESFLTTILRSKDLKRIMPTFFQYWFFYKEINEFLPKTEWVLLQEIDNEEVLKAVYTLRSRHCFVEQDKIEVRTLLREGVIHNSKHYKVNLPQETINRFISMI